MILISQASGHNMRRIGSFNRYQPIGCWTYTSGSQCTSPNDYISTIDCLVQDVTIRYNIIQSDCDMLCYRSVQSSIADVACTWKIYRDIEVTMDLTGHTDMILEKLAVLVDRQSSESAPLVNLSLCRRRVLIIRFYISTSTMIIRCIEGGK